MNCNPDINRMECWIFQHNPFVKRMPVIYAGENPFSGTQHFPSEMSEGDNHAEPFGDKYEVDGDDLPECENDEKERINRLWNMLLEQTILLHLTCESAMETHDVIKDAGSDGDRALLGNLMVFFQNIHKNADEIIDYLEAHSTPKEA